MFKYYIIVIASAFFNIISSYYLKKGAISKTDDGILGLININLFMGLLALGLAFIAYYISLSKININIVYPTITACTLIGVVLISHFVFQESMSIKHFVAICIILLGVGLMYS
jgi:multidrug transporter EmrE-like cation transporter